MSVLSVLWVTSNWPNPGTECAQRYSCFRYWIVETRIVENVAFAAYVWRDIAKRDNWRVTVELMVLQSILTTYTNLRYERRTTKGATAGFRPWFLNGRMEHTLEILYKRGLWCRWPHNRATGTEFPSWPVYNDCARARSWVSFISHIKMPSLHSKFLFVILQKPYFWTLGPLAEKRPVWWRGHIVEHARMLQSVVEKKAAPQLRPKSTGATRPAFTSSGVLLTVNWLMYAGTVPSRTHLSGPSGTTGMDAPTFPHPLLLTVLCYRQSYPTPLPRAPCPLYLKRRCIIQVTNLCSCSNNWTIAKKINIKNKKRIAWWMGYSTFYFTVDRWGCF